jgi:hypothetical protein
VLAQKNTKLHAVLWRKKSWAPQLLLRFLRLTNFCRGFIVTDLISVCWSVPAWSSGLRFIPDSSLIYVSSIKFTAGPDACRLSPWRFKTQHSFLKIQGSFISRSPPSILPDYNFPVQLFSIINSTGVIQSRHFIGRLLI